MNLFELTKSEDHPAYQTLEIANGNRQYNFLRSIVIAALETKRTFLSQTILKALNFHAIACLHSHAGEYRPCSVTITNSKHTPPDHYRVQSLMDDFVNEVNHSWNAIDPVYLAAFVLWKINYIHPFINGNGRTARAASYFVLCVKSKAWLPGEIILPQLLRQHRDEYVFALTSADASLGTDSLDLSELHALINRLLKQQFGLGESPPLNE